MLGSRSFDLKLLQPESSVAFSGAGDAGELGGGWRGVYKWCLQATKRNKGSVRFDPLFLAYDLLIVHLDADVATEDPANYSVFPIPELAGLLPCSQPCPPCSETTDRLRALIRIWLGDSSTPPRTVFCTPSMSIEAWVVAICFPNDREVRKASWECHPKPERRLAQQPKNDRFAKKQTDYMNNQQRLQEGWPRIAERLFEAKRFRDEFTLAVS